MKRHFTAAVLLGAVWCTVLIVASPVLIVAQGSGQFAGRTQCFIDGKWTTVVGSTCPGSGGGGGNGPGGGRGERLPQPTEDELRLQREQRENQHQVDLGVASFNSGLQEEKAGHWVAAEAHYREAIAHWGPWHVCARLAYVLDVQGKYEDAITWYGQVIQRTYYEAGNRDHIPVVYNNIGVAYLNLGRYEDAAREFRWALEKAPGYTPAKDNLAIAQKELDRTIVGDMRRVLQGSTGPRSGAPPTASGLDFVPLETQTAVQPGETRHYRPSGNGLIGGTTWIVGYNVQSADPKLVAKERAMMTQQMKLAGIQYAVDLDHYNFVLGIAASTEPFTDLRQRVVFDELKKGQYSASYQQAYASLKDRQFKELACHSNGAMICLAALENKDVVADSVALYGPQITVESLQMWDDLVRSGRVKSVQVYINQGDPVPPISMLVGGGVATAAANTVAFFKPKALARIINETAPRLTVRTFACSDGIPTLTCHAMTAYKDRAQSSGQVVPGTRSAFPGQGSYVEPPRP